MSKIKLQKRSEVPEHEKWNTTSLFENRQAMLDEAESTFKAVKKLADFKGKIGLDASSFYNFISSYDELMGRWIRVYTYSFINTAVDATNPEYLEDASKIRAMNAEIEEILSFYKSDICSIDEKKLESFYAEKPELNEFKRFVDDVYKYKKHLLSEETEQVLAAFGNVLHAPEYIYDISCSSDMHFDDFEDDKGNILPNSFTLFEEKYQDDENTTLRRNAFKSFNKGLKQHVNTYASIYATELERQRIEAKLRGFDSTIDMLLFKQGIEREAYDTQLKVLFDTLSPHMRKYARIIKKQLNLDELTFADLKVALDEDKSPKTDFEGVKEIVLDALSIYGDEYMANMHRMFDARLIDYSQNIGKSSGAFCTSPHGADSFIKMTFTGTMRSAFTLVHELGHAGHFQLANKYQKSLNSDCSMYCVEAPSTTNELMLSKYLMEKAENKEIERWVILQNIASYYHNCVTHFLEARLQDRLYKHIDKGGQINASFLNKEKHAVIQEFWGDAVKVEEEAGMTWMRQSHYYNGLYPYTYSASLSIGTHVYKMIQKEGDVAIKKWLEVLKSGGVLKTSDLLKKVDIDISKPDMFISLSEYVGELVDRLEVLYE